ncbi:MAG: glycoside hydrolase family 3 N-terminal domain-containing protein [Jatrophihabitantaceae bacterium]
MRLLPVLACAALLAASACTSSGAVSSTTRPPSTRPAPHSTTVRPSTTRPPARTASAPATATPAPLDPAQRALARLSLAQRVGQLIMVDCPSSGVTSATATAIQRDHAGSVILDGTSHLGVTGTRAVTDRLRSLAPADPGLFVSTDQEGGLVQRMQGPGFETIPSAVDQGADSPAQIRALTRSWGQELLSAGINVDLAPVLDTVPPDGRGNPPIGDLDREYGRDPGQVARLGNAVVRGLADAGVDATVKHFPGLGRVTGNTDTASGVVDQETTRDDAYLLPFRRAIANGVPFVMVSTGIYARIDPNNIAAFSPTIVTGMLRHDLGFRGVIITDDISAAAQVAGIPPGQRAVAFVQAGGTMLLTVVASIVAPMTAALIDRAHHDPAFRRKVDAAALVVLRAKQARGLLG